MRMATKTGDYQVNPKYLFAYNNEDHHKDIYVPRPVKIAIEIAR